MPVRNESETPLESPAEDFVERLRNYSRSVSEGLDLQAPATAAAKLAGMSTAACVAMTAHQSAEAAIRYSGPLVGGSQVQAFGFSDFAFSNATFSIDGLANFGVSAARFSAYYLYGLRQVGFGTTGTANSTGVPGPKGEQIVFAPGANGDNQPDRLAAGATIDANSPWFAPALNAGNNNKALIQANNYFPYSAFSGNNWPNPAAGFAYYPYGNYYSATGFAGIRFDTAGGAAKHNGWVRLRLINNGYGSSGGFPTSAQVAWIEALDWAYETTPDAPIQIPTPLPGDYNGDGVVDAADYTVGRDAQGVNYPLLNRDPNAEGAPEVDGDDIAFWATQYGASNASAAAIPEPGATTLLSLGLLATGASGVRRHRRAQQLSNETGQ